MVCPKCGFEQQDDIECLQCGIVFEKYVDHVESVRHPSVIATSHPQPSRVSLPLKGLLRSALLLGMGLFAISYLLQDGLPDGDDILEDLLQHPVQRAVDVAPFEIEAGEILYTITPLYTYELYGMVVSYHNCGTWWDIYHHDQWKDFINVKDLCVVWGKNVQTEVYKDMKFTSDSWTCTYYWPNDEVGSRFDYTSLSNNHILSHDESVTKSILKTQGGDQIYLRGYLAEYSHSNRDFHRGTSTNRIDTGNGACETIFVEDYQILKAGNPLWRMTFTISKYVILLSLLLLIIRFFRSTLTS